MSELPPPLEVDGVLRAAAREICADFDELLGKLATAPVYRCGEQNAPPKRPGVHVFSEQGVVRHVGGTGDLQRRRREQTGLNNDRNTATFAFRSAIGEAQADHSDLSYALWVVLNLSDDPTSSHTLRHGRRASATWTCAASRLTAPPSVTCSR